MEKSYNFSNIKFSDLQEIVKIIPKRDLSKFNEWFDFDYPISEVEISFLDNLIEKHALYLPFYLEDTLKMKFLSPILNKVDFSNQNIHDWYHVSISGSVNGVELKGFADYVVAKGIFEPQKPYFFVQEFKPSIPDGNPEVQLLAELLILIEKNKTTLVRGAYIIGQVWKFMILEKKAENNFEYFVSQVFDALKLNDLKQIYINLQAIKLKYCQE